MSSSRSVPTTGSGPGIEARAGLGICPARSATRRHASSTARSRADADAKPLCLGPGDSRIREIQAQQGSHDLVDGVGAASVPPPPSGGPQASAASAQLLGGAATGNPVGHVPFAGEPGNSRILTDAATAAEARHDGPGVLAPDAVVVRQDDDILTPEVSRVARPPLPAPPGSWSRSGPGRPELLRSSRPRG